jgi:hypothetical protein
MHWIREWGLVYGIYPWVSTLVMGNLTGRRFWVERGCFFLGGVGAEKSRRSRQITPRQPTDHFSVFFSDFRVATALTPQFHESATFYIPLKKKEKPTVAIFRTGLPATFFCCCGM